MIEMLVVIVIIGILASFVAVGVHSAINSAKNSTTEGMIKALVGACGTYYTQWGDYPPTDLQEIGGSGINDLNNGIEALVACLSSKKGGGIKYTADEGFLDNMDGDKASSNVTDWYYGDTQLREYMDAYGTPLAYYHHKDYAKAGPRLVKYKLQRKAEPVEIKPFKSPATATYVGPASFQIRSVGLDGKPGTPDDIVFGR
jgi:prepilin-type N-terminal cleavage/methylation domain-containing protein